MGFQMALILKVSEICKCFFPEALRCSEWRAGHILSSQEFTGKENSDEPDFFSFFFKPLLSLLTQVCLFHLLGSLGCRIGWFGGGVRHRGGRAEDDGDP